MMADLTATAWRVVGAPLRIVVAVAACVAVAPAATLAGCNWDDIAAEGIQAASIRTGSPRMHFVQDAVLRDGCLIDSANCRARAFLTPNDMVLAAPIQGAFTCAGFSNGRGTETIGWLPTAALQLLPEAQRAPADLIGTWVAPERCLVLSPGRGVLAVQGDATWGDTTERRQRGDVNTGEVSGQVRPERGVVAFMMGLDGQTLPYTEGDETDCRIPLWQRGLYLARLIHRVSGYRLADVA